MPFGARYQEESMQRPAPDSRTMEEEVREKRRAPRTGAMQPRTPTRRMLVVLKGALSLSAEKRGPDMCQDSSLPAWVLP